MSQFHVYLVRARHDDLIRAAERHRLGAGIQPDQSDTRRARLLVRLVPAFLHHPLSTRSAATAAPTTRAAGDRPSGQAEPAAAGGRASG